MPGQANDPLPSWTRGFGWSFAALVGVLALWVVGNASQIRGGVFHRLPLVLSYSILSFDVYALAMTQRRQQLVEGGGYNAHQDIAVHVLLVVHLCMYAIAMGFDFAQVPWTEVGPQWLIDLAYIGLTYVAWCGAGLFLKWTAPEEQAH